MPRNLDPALQEAFASGLILPAILVNLAFVTSTQFVWSGIGDLVFNGNTYKGVGSLGKLGTINEGLDVNAYGTSVTLSGIDNTLFNDSLTDIQQGLPATVYIALFTNTGTMIGTPYMMFDGLIDEPSISLGADTSSITLNLENSMLDGKRASNIRYTDADQRIAFPTDSGFQFVTSLQDAAFVWG
jgi:hypothetical protein